ncbi:hypothetical protein ALC57_15716 [Trachymyrmex cornetzi]|uniref:Mos1 transposase HTH domain-containing protein n=1 Tax=Trachymyrmex cornetzi TaxID=471704 RepID=A0A151IWG8_9HYME|nr:hypothetical protein ALC57_15716 [Trachymyrmex cornetzi]
MELNLQQRVCIKFCVKNGFNGAKTLEMLRNCFGSDAVKKTTVYEWHERFRSSRESVVNPSRMTNAVASRQHRKPTKTSIKTKRIPSEGNGKIEDGSDGYTDNRVPEMFRELD